MTNYNRIVLERGKKKTFASALDWPGWSRSGKSDEDAIAVLTSYADRYRIVADRAGVQGVAETAANPQVVDTLAGSGATDFGVPDRISDLENEFFSQAECERQLSLLKASWEFFDDVASRVSSELQKGPRGGGRDRDEIIEHTLRAETGYARRIDVKTPTAQVDDAEGVRAHREAVLAGVREANRNQLETRWPLRYFLRRAAWHVLDHAWEMEDKDLSEKDGTE